MPPKKCLDTQTVSGADDTPLNGALLKLKWPQALGVFVGKYSSYWVTIKPQIPYELYLLSCSHKSIPTRTRRRI